MIVEITDISEECSFWFNNVRNYRRLEEVATYFFWASKVSYFNVVQFPEDFAVNINPHENIKSRQIPFNIQVLWCDGRSR
jgi:hypothetical protein